MKETAVLVMAYGSPRTLEEVAPYFKDIRGGRDPSPEALEELTARYERIGGPSPLNEITQNQARALEAALSDTPVYVGMKHWHPFIYEAVTEIHKDEIEKVAGLVLAPHYSSKSIGEYEKRVVDAREQLGARFDLEMVSSWYDHPSFASFVARNLASAMKGWDGSDGATRVFFTAHSIPLKIIESGDPYAEQLADSARIYAAAASITDYEIAWQSASSTGEPWIGPDILESLESFARGGGKRALIAPVGFTSDHLEVLYDVDVECAEKATELGIELRRVDSPNDDPAFVAALAEIVGGVL